MTSYHDTLIIPPDMNFEQAASFLLNFATAFYALYELARVRQSDKILIHSGAGGVGMHSSIGLIFANKQ